jgi:hypothetical protein
MTPTDQTAHLRHIAALLAQDGDSKTDGECLNEVWRYLQSLGVNPDNFRPERND